MRRRRLVLTWESDEDRVRRHMKIPAAVKLEWLEKMRALSAALPKKTLALRRKLRG